MRRTLQVACLAAAITGSSLAIRAAADSDEELQFQLANLLFEETRYREALDAYGRAASAGDAALSVSARKGRIRTALRLAEFDLAKNEAATLQAQVPRDPEALTLSGDALWSFGLFDDADKAYSDAAALAPESSRARFGRARTLAALNRIDQSLDLALSASALAPRDGEIHALVADLYRRQNRFDQAANSYSSYINLLPNKDRSEKAAWARAQVDFLESFEGVTPTEIDAEDLDALHTLPFKLVRDKIVVQARVNGGRLQDFVLDTGSEETVISRETAQRERIRPVTYTLSAGVGEVGLRGLQLSRLKSLDLGTLQIRNLPVLIKNPALRGIPRREGESFSPLAIGLSMLIDYEKKLLTIGRTLPDMQADFRLPMRVHRLAMVRGVLNDTHPTYFVVDTGGEVISISAATARILPPSPHRRIPLRVWGTSGWDRDAFLLPGVDLDFDRIEYNNFSMVVLNLRAPSLLLGFQVGGIVGHRFLAPYRVAMDLANSELRLQKF